MKALVLQGDANSANVFGLPFPNHVDARVLAPSVAESHTIPAGARFVLFSADDDFYARFDGTATIPAGDITDGSASEINPTVRAIDGATTIGLIAENVTIVTLSFYS